MLHDLLQAGRLRSDKGQVTERGRFACLDVTTWSRIAFAPIPIANRKCEFENSAKIEKSKIATRKLTPPLRIAQTPLVHNGFVAESAIWHQPPPPRRRLKRGFTILLRRALRTVFRGKSGDWISKALPVARETMGSQEARMNLFHLASQVLAFRVPGHFAEVGCNSGESSVVLQMVLKKLDPTREFHVFDSFEGTPEAGVQDEGAYERGEMATSEEAFKANFAAMGLPLPTIHPGWFDQTLPKGLPEHLAFCLIDADLYQSTLTALEHVYPKLSPGAICAFGVYCDTHVFTPRLSSLKYRSPGVKKACDEFFADKPEKVSVLFAGPYTTGYFRKGVRS